MLVAPSALLLLAIAAGTVPNRSARAQEAQQETSGAGSETGQQAESNVPSITFTRPTQETDRGDSKVDAAGENAESEGSTSGKFDDMTAEVLPPDATPVIEEFKEKAPDDLREEGLAAVAVFEESAAELADVVMAMRRKHTEFVNGLETDKQVYREARNQSREAFKETYQAAMKVLQFMPHPVAARYVVTTIDHREKLGQYEISTLEGAAGLLQVGVRLRYVALAAARSAMMTGNFEYAKQIYDKMEPDELEDTDRALIAQAEIIEKQFNTEQELLAKDPDDLPRVRFKTTRGDFVVELYIQQAPSTVSHFIQLVESGFYDGLDFFQVIDGLLALTGDPLGDGSSRPDRYLADEIRGQDVRMPLRGSLVMAKLPIPGTSDFVPNSAGTQFAILFVPLPTLIDHQTVFGRVVEGMDVIAEFRRVDPNKEKKKNEIVLPPDRILEAEVINRPDTLPEVNYATPGAIPE
ncbi:peptidylprolyl isomerase [Roseiconus nitratireducens]|uniref:peptidylprolyl isomerase n=1 Tax=Roseiconus nitratireducens TaxID=2605748 RepID=UPI0013760A27|nr:peptidylprolyl isomerase [Roseiconus nitratireducens]